MEIVSNRRCAVQTVTSGTRKHQPKRTMPLIQLNHCLHKIQAYPRTFEYYYPRPASLTSGDSVMIDDLLDHLFNQRRQVFFRLDCRQKTCRIPFMPLPPSAAFMQTQALTWQTNIRFINTGVTPSNAPTLIKCMH